MLGERIGRAPNGNKYQYSRPIREAQKTIHPQRSESLCSHFDQRKHRSGELSWADKNYCRTIVLNRSGTLVGSLERLRPLEKCQLTSVRCPSAERLGTTVLHFFQPRTDKAPRWRRSPVYCFSPGKDVYRGGRKYP